MSTPDTKDPKNGQFNSELLKGKPNPHWVPSGSQFKPGNPGKPLGAKHKISAAFLQAVHDDFTVHGADTLARVRETDPSTYIRVISSLLPKEITGADGEPLLTGITVTFVRPDAP